MTIGQGNQAATQVSHQGVVHVHHHQACPLMQAACPTTAQTTLQPLRFPTQTPVHNLADGVSYIFSSFLEAAGYTVGRARAYTGTAANLATQVRGGGWLWGRQLG